jgi:peptide/nickel transport system ATP-binding protein
LELRDTFGTGVILVTHNLGVAAYMANQLLVMEQGRVVDQGTREQILYHPTSDYTKKLLRSVPELEGNPFA